MADGAKDPGNVERPVADGADAIWSTDDIPVRDGPLDLVWAPRASAPNEPIEPIEAAHQRPRLDNSATPSTVDTDSNERSLRSKLLISGAVFVVVAIVVGILVRSGGADESAVPDTTNDAETTIDATTADPSTTLEVPLTTEASVGSQADALAEASTAPIKLELPSSVAAIQTPTEIVMLTANGLLHTLSLPSGLVRSVSTEASLLNGGNVVVAPEATAILPADGGAIVIVPRTGPPISVSADEFGAGIGGMELRGWMRMGDGSARFLVTTYPESCCNEPSVTSVGVDGDLVPLLGPLTLTSGAELSTPDGTWIVNDAGGAYEIDASGTSRRIDSGVVQAAVHDHRVVRECDDSQRCSTVLVRISTGDRRVIDADLLPDNFNRMTYSMSLAPDGSAVSMIRDGPTPERVLIDLDVGEVAAAPYAYWSVGSTWAADSSGIFDIATEGPGLKFVARTGETVGFGAGLDQVVALGVRWPDSELDPGVIVVSEPVNAARPLGPTGITLIGAMTGGGMTYIDIDAGVAQSWAATERLGGDLTLIKSADSILAFGKTDDPAFAFRQGVQEPLDAVFATTGVKLPGPVDGTIWVPAPELGAGGGGVAYRLVTVDGLGFDSDRATIDLRDAKLVGGDGRGGLVVTRAGDVFIVGMDGTERLTTGDLIAIGADTAYVRECAAIDTCDITRIDRRSGDRSTPVGGFEADDLSPPAPPKATALGSSVSPDGEVVLVRRSVAPTDSASEAPPVDGWFFVDTREGRLTPIDALDADQPIVWSPDSNFAAVLVDSTLLVFDRATGELVPLSAPRLRAIGTATSPFPTAPPD